LMEDTNGNQITVSYLPGAGPYAPNGNGWNPSNTSARINQIVDTRNTNTLNPVVYQFTYSASADTINHLTGITNKIGTSENFTFTMNIGQQLNSPFAGTTACGSTNTNCGTVGYLASVTRTGVNLTTSFSYDGNGYGDLQQVTFPYGGHLRWAYRNFAYSGGRGLREVSARYLLKDVTASETTYSIAHDDVGDASRVVHYWTALSDPSGTSGKAWHFNFDPSLGWLVGKMSLYRWADSAYNSVTPQHWDVLAWSLDAGGNPYISRTDTYLNLGTGYQRQSATTTTLDSKGYGNVVSSSVYDYAAAGSNPPLSRTTTNTYLHDSNSAYDAAYIRNRVLTTTMTPAGGSAIQMANNTYDNYTQGLVVDTYYSLYQHDSSIGTSYTQRGNVTNAWTPSGSMQKGYDIQGNVVKTLDNLGHTNTINVDQFGNMPASVTPNGNNNLSTSFSFNSFLAPTSVAVPSNGTSANATYDTYGRMKTSSSPDGAVTTYYYCPDACGGLSFTMPATRNGQNFTKIAVVNTRWSRETYDGLGRVIRTERGDTSGNLISTVDTDYNSCGCSATGKMSRTSLPYGPGQTPVWTTYTYDALGRTLAVTAADGASTTHYAYYGNMTVTTDPAGKWKAISTDINGNLRSVLEPDPSAPGGPAAAPATIPACAAGPTCASGMVGT